MKKSFLTEFLIKTSHHNFATRLMRVPLLSIVKSSVTVFKPQILVYSYTNIETNKEQHKSFDYLKMSNKYVRYFSKPRFP